MTPWGPVVTQLRQSWRRGEYAPVLRFYQEAGIPVFRMVTAGALEGGDVMIVEPGSVLIGERGDAHRGAGRRAARGVVPGERLGGPGGADPGPLRAHRRAGRGAGRAARRGLHRGGLLGARRLAAGEGLRADRGRRPRTPSGSASTRSRSAPSGCSRAPGRRRSTTRFGAHGLEVFAPDLEMFTLGGGGAHCLGQALRRERMGWLRPCGRRRAGDRRPARAGPPHRRARRVRAGSAGEPEWREARAFLEELLDELGLAFERDEAGNLWTPDGRDRRRGAGARLAPRLGPARAAGSTAASG